MNLKDYYKILEIEPPATLSQIKHAYRKLAKQYHPDKNADNLYAGSYFAEISEAYEVLTNPEKKEQYLQKRWYAQSIGIKKLRTDPLTPSLIIKQLIELARYVSTLDVYRANKEKIFIELNSILSDTSLDILKNVNDHQANRQVTTMALKVMDYLPLHNSKSIATKLKLLNKEDHNLIKQIDQLISTQYKVKQQEKYTPWLLALATILLCITIYLTSR